jgi:hypothetical protein
MAYGPRELAPGGLLGAGDAADRWTYTGPGYPRVLALGNGQRRVEYTPEQSATGPEWVAPSLEASGMPGVYPALRSREDREAGSYELFVTPGFVRSGNLFDTPQPIKTCPGSGIELWPVAWRPNDPPGQVCEGLPPLDDPYNDCRRDVPGATWQEYPTRVYGSSGWSAGPTFYRRTDRGGTPFCLGGQELQPWESPISPVGGPDALFGTTLTMPDGSRIYVPPGGTWPYMDPESPWFGWPVIDRCATWGESWCGPWSGGGGWGEEPCAPGYARAGPGESCLPIPGGGGGVDTGGGGEDEPPTPCPEGYVRSSEGNCVRVTGTVECPGGIIDPATGECIPWEPPAPGGGGGDQDDELVPCYDDATGATGYVDPLTGLCVPAGGGANGNGNGNGNGGNGGGGAGAGLSDGAIAAVAAAGLGLLFLAGGRRRRARSNPRGGFGWGGDFAAGDRVQSKFPPSYGTVERVYTDERGAPRVVVRYDSGVTMDVDERRLRGVGF